MGNATKYYWGIGDYSKVVVSIHQFCHVQWFLIINLVTTLFIYTYTLIFLLNKFKGEILQPCKIHIRIIHIYPFILLNKLEVGRIWIAVLANDAICQFMAVREVAEWSHGMRVKGHTQKTDSGCRQRSMIMGGGKSRSEMVLQVIRCVGVKQYV